MLLTSPETRQVYKKQQEEFLSLKKVEAKLCAQNVGPELKYMGTTYVARDIEFMTRVIDGEDALM